jgi:hemerythrin-like domain-containing protein
MRRCVTDYMVQEHQVMSLLLNELQDELGVLRLSRDNRKPTERLAGLRRKIAQALHTHVMGEEQVLYTALEDHVKGIAFTLERMRHEHDTGQHTEKTFHATLDRLTQGSGSPHDVMQAGRQYITWLRHHLLEENGRLFPMVERGLDLAVQQQVRRGLEEISQETSAPVTEGPAYPASA